MTTSALEPRLATAGASLLVRALRQQPTPTSQDESQATYCAAHRARRRADRLDAAGSRRSLTRYARIAAGQAAFTMFETRQLKMLRAWPADGPPASTRFRWRPHLACHSVATGDALAATGRDPARGSPRDEWRRPAARIPEPQPAQNWHSPRRCRARCPVCCPMSSRSLPSRSANRPYRGRQIFEWIHRRGVLDPPQMTNLPVEVREPPR